jgi:MinD-like ATPase involved in chromosome partitioning or flagellar assembly
VKRQESKANGRLFVFLGAKGGAGVTTIACNFSVALAKASEQRTLLIDLDLPLGDAALNLGIVSEYSSFHAFQNIERLDGSFLSKLLVKHESGVFVLAAPGKFPNYYVTNEAIDQLIVIARQEFDNVVVDVGSKQDLSGTILFKDASTIYLITQAGVSELRNSNRMISQLCSEGNSNLEIVVNRFEPRTFGVNERDIEEILKKPIRWKIPDNYTVVRKMQNSGIPLVLEDSSISKQIKMMARAACGMPLAPARGSFFNFRKLGQGFSSRISRHSDAPMTLQLTEEPAKSEDANETIRDSSPEKITVVQPEAPAAVAIEKMDAAERTPEPSPKETEQGMATMENSSGASAEVETRIYKGATYIKGADGQWHLQHMPGKEAKAEESVSGNDSEREDPISSSSAATEASAVVPSQDGAKVEEITEYSFLDNPAESTATVFPVYQGTDSETEIEPPKHAWRPQGFDANGEQGEADSGAASNSVATADPPVSSFQEPSSKENVDECPLDRLEVSTVPLLEAADGNSETEEILRPQLQLLPSGVKPDGLKRRIRIKGRIHRAEVAPVEESQTIPVSVAGPELVQDPKLVGNVEGETPSTPEAATLETITSEKEAEEDALGQEEQVAPAAARGLRRRIRIKGMTRIAATAHAVAAKVQPATPGLKIEALEKKHSDGIVNRIGSTETRTYKGAIYARGADGQWYLQ